MKSFLVWLGKKIISGIFITLFSVLTVLGIAYAITYPGTPPVGEIAGWKFATVLNNILQSGNYVTDTTGKVKLATLSDNATKLGGFPASNYLKTEVDPKIGTLTNGGWCKELNGKVDCTTTTNPGGGVSCQEFTPGIFGIWWTNKTYQHSEIWILGSGPVANGNGGNAVYTIKQCLNGTAKTIGDIVWGANGCCMF